MWDLWQQRVSSVLAALVHSILAVKDMNAGVDVRGESGNPGACLCPGRDGICGDRISADGRRKCVWNILPKVPHDASEKMDDTLMAKLEPYRFDTLRTFQIPYLAGFEADQGDYRSEDLLSEVKQQVAGYAAEYARSTISGYTSVHIDHQQMDYENISSDYVYLPIWFISYRYRDKDYIFAMNGQTGKVIGEPPQSRGQKAAGWFAGISAWPLLH
ncbi:MAG: hypothetical protein ACLR1V_09835 [Coprococcus sp.]